MNFFSTLKSAFTKDYRLSTKSFYEFNSRLQNLKDNFINLKQSILDLYTNST